MPLKLLLFITFHVAIANCLSGDVRYQAIFKGDIKSFFNQASKAKREVESPSRSLYPHVTRDFWDYLFSDLFLGSPIEKDDKACNDRTNFLRNKRHIMPFEDEECISHRIVCPQEENVDSVYVGPMNDCESHSRKKMRKEEPLRRLLSSCEDEPIGRILQHLNYASNSKPKCSHGEYHIHDEDERAISDIEPTDEVSEDEGDEDEVVDDAPQFVKRSRFQKRHVPTNSGDSRQGIKVNNKKTATRFDSDICDEAYNNTYKNKEPHPFDTMNFDTVSPSNTVTSCLDDFVLNWLRDFSTQPDMINTKYKSAGERDKNCRNSESESRIDEVPSREETIDKVVTPELLYFQEPKKFSASSDDLSWNARSVPISKSEPHHGPTTLELEPDSLYHARRRIYPKNKNQEKGATKIEEIFNREDLVPGMPLQKKFSTGEAKDDSAWSHPLFTLEAPHVRRNCKWETPEFETETKPHVNKISGGGLDEMVRELIKLIGKKEKHENDINEKDPVNSENHFADKDATYEFNKGLWIPKPGKLNSVNNEASKEIKQDENIHLDYSEAPAPRPKNIMARYREIEKTVRDRWSRLPRTLKPVTENIEQRHNTHSNTGVKPEFTFENKLAADAESLRVKPAGSCNFWVPNFYQPFGAVENSFLEKSKLACTPSNCYHETPVLFRTPSTFSHFSPDQRKSSNIKECNEVFRDGRIDDPTKVLSNMIQNQLAIEEPRTSTKELAVNVVVPNSTENPLHKEPVGCWRHRSPIWGPICPWFPPVHQKSEATSHSSFTPDLISFKLMSVPKKPDENKQHFDVRLSIVPRLSEPQATQIERPEVLEKKRHEMLDRFVPVRYSRPARIHCTYKPQKAPIDKLFNVLSVFWPLYSTNPAGTLASALCYTAHYFYPYL